MGRHLNFSIFELKIRSKDSKKKKKKIQIRGDKKLNGQSHWIGSYFDFYYKKFAIPKIDQIRCALEAHNWNRKIGLDWLGLWEENWNHKFILV